MADNKFHTAQILNNLNKVKKTLPVVLANQAQNFFVDSFKKEGFQTGSGVLKWKMVKRRIPGTYEYKYPKKKQLSRRSSPILVRTGKLRRAVGNSIRSATFDRVELTVGVPYASYHNEGTDDIPKRQFVGDSKALRVMQVKTLNQTIDGIWRV